MPAAATNRWKLGLFVVTGIAISFGALLALGAQRFGRETFDAVTYFGESVQGLDPGAPVKWRGIKIGNVSQITAAPDQRLVEVHMTVEMNLLRRLRLAAKETHVRTLQGPPPDFRLELASTGITGQKFLLGDFFDPVAYPPAKLTFEPPAHYIPSVPSTLQNVEEAVLQVASRMPELTDSARSILRRVDRLLAGAEDEKLVGRIRDVLDSANARLGGFDVADLAKRGGATLDEARATFGEAKRLAANIEGALEAARVEASAAAFRETASGLTDAARGVRELRDELEAGLRTLRDTLEAVRKLAEVLERDPSAVIYGKSHEPPPERAHP